MTMTSPLRGTVNRSAVRRLARERNFQVSPDAIDFLDSITTSIVESLLRPSRRDMRRLTLKDVSNIKSVVVQIKESGPFVTLEGDEGSISASAPS